MVSSIKLLGKNDFVVLCLAESAWTLLKALKIYREGKFHCLIFKLRIFLWLLMASQGEV